MSITEHFNEATEGYLLKIDTMIKQFVFRLCIFNNSLKAQKT